MDIEHCDFISGYEFYKISNWSFCPRYPVKLDPSQIKENDIVFINLDNFNEFIKILLNNRPRNKFILISHNSDVTFTESHFNIIHPFVNKVYAINAQLNYNSNNIVNNIPIGFIDNKYKPHYKYTNILLKQHEKSTLIYMNFNMKTNPVKRAECYNTFVDKPWVLIESKVLPELFYEKLAMSKYVLSPEGTVVDCHRIYESIFFNSIPILKSNDLDSFYKKLPVITVKEWSDITEDFLIKNYEMYLSNLNKWKLDNKEWTCPKFWLSNYTIPLSELRPPS